MNQNLGVVIAGAITAFGLGALGVSPTFATAVALPPAGDAASFPAKQSSASITDIEGDLARGILPEEVLHDFRHLYPGVADTNLRAMWATQDVRATAVE